MKVALLVACIFASLFAAVLSDGTAYYAPEYDATPQEHTGVRTKRHVSALPFLVGVAAGGIFGPILYNKLYGWKPTVAWKEPENQGWQAPQQQQGWQEPQQQQGWQAPSNGWEGKGQQSGGYN